MLKYIFLVLLFGRCLHCEDFELVIYSADVVLQGQTFPIVLTLRELPPNAFILQVLSESDDYLIAKFQTAADDETNVWHYSTNLEQIMQAHGVSDDMESAYVEGYYHIEFATFFNLGETWIYANIIFEAAESEYVYAMFTIEPNENHKCVPDMNFEQCNDALNPLSLNASEPFTFSGEIETCPEAEIQKFEWTVWDYEGKHKIAAFGYTAIPELNVQLQNYNLKSDTNLEMDKDCLMLLISVQTTAGASAERCYIRMEYATIYPVIVGGHNRHVKHHTSFLLDGSRSYLKTSEGKSQDDLSYEWTCSIAKCRVETDPCPNIKRNESIIILPSSHLTLKCTYIFQLNVSAMGLDSHATRQYVYITDLDLMKVKVYCIKNCQERTYNIRYPIELEAKCLDAKGPVKWVWKLNDHTIAFQSRLTLKLTNTEAITLTIDAYEKYRHGYLEHNMKINRGPTTGKCKIVPMTGDEYFTDFEISCVDFQARYKPLVKIVSAAKVLLNIFHGDTVELKLPACTYVKVEICDSLGVCVLVKLKVNVIQMPIDTRSSETMIEDLENMDLNRLLEQGQEQIVAIALNSAGNDIKEPAEGLALLEYYKNFSSDSILELGFLVNLTGTFFFRLDPLNYMRSPLWVNAVKLINDMFDKFTITSDVEKLKSPEYHRIARSSVVVYRLYKQYVEHLDHPRRSISKLLGIRKNINKTVLQTIERKIDKIPLFITREKTLLWMKAEYELYRLYKHLKFTSKVDHLMDHVRKYSIFSKHEEAGVTSLCVFSNNSDPVDIKTSDGNAKAVISTELFKELVQYFENPKGVCFHVIIIVRHLNWWFPDLRVPSNRIVRVEIFTESDKVLKNNKILKHSIEVTVINERSKYIDRKIWPRRMDYGNLNFEDIEDSAYMENSAMTKQGRRNMVYHQLIAKNPFLEGHYYDMTRQDELFRKSDIQMYRVNIEGHTLLAIQILSTTHALRILIELNEQPHAKKVLESKVVVINNRESHTVLLRNNCNVTHLVYMGVAVYDKNKTQKHPNVFEKKRDDDGEMIEDGPVRFSFIFQTRECNYWNEERLEWDRTGCLPRLDVSIDGGIRCFCKNAGAYTSYVYYQAAVSVPIFYTIPHKAITILIFYVVLLLSIFITLLLVWRFGNRHRTVMCSKPNEWVSQNMPEHEFLMHLKTAGRTNSLTTANIWIKFKTQDGKQICFNIMQDPLHPQLLTNTTHTLVIRSRLIRLPVSLSIGHDGNGRYPSWFLYSIVIQDVTEQTTQIFKINRCLRSKQIVVPRGKMQGKGIDYSGKWSTRLKSSVERNFTNWFFLQPVLGDWRWELGYRKFSRFERTCIWISKLMVMFTVCIVYSGKSSDKDHAQFFEHNLYNNTGDYFCMAVICCVLSNLVQYFFEFILIKL